MGKKAKRKRPYCKRKKSYPNPFIHLTIIFLILSLVFIASLNLYYLFFNKKSQSLKEIKSYSSNYNDYIKKEEKEFLQALPKEKEPENIKVNPLGKSYITQKDQEIKIKAQDNPISNHKEPAKRGLLAIIIDDIGNNIHLDRQIINIPHPITLSFLPHLNYTKEGMILASKSGKEIMLHQPMEPVDKNINPGFGSFKINMTAEEIEYLFNNNLREVELAVGVNNHMGSRFTQNSEKMSYFLNILREKGLFYVDSLTHPNSVGYELSIKMGIKTLKRDVFLDAINNKYEIRKNLYLSVKIAQKNGKAIAIGHPYPETIEVLKEELDNVSNMITLVFVSELLDDFSN